MEAKIDPLNVFCLQVNHNLSEIRRQREWGIRGKKEGVGRGRVGVG